MRDFISHFFICPLDNERGAGHGSAPKFPLYHMSHLFVKYFFVVNLHKDLPVILVILYIANFKKF